MYDKHCLVSFVTFLEREKSLWYNVSSSIRIPIYIFSPEIFPNLKHWGFSHR